MACRIVNVPPSDFASVSVPTIVRGWVKDWTWIDEWSTPLGMKKSIGHHFINGRRTSLGYDEMLLSDFIDRAHLEHIIVMDDDRMTSAEDVLLDAVFRNVSIPRIVRPSSVKTRILSVGGGTRGVDFMKHCVAWLGMVSGSKRWYFAPPATPQLKTTCEAPSSDARISTCISNATDVVLVPEMWWHATCNLAPHTVALGTQCFPMDKLEL